jgi:acetoin:2,6-dichlorophenolindophenol oxidoreductase subunit alpha
MHVADFSRGILGANGIVGGGIGLAVGAALAAQLDGKGAVSTVFFGDGGANQGVLSEALNVSAVWKLPLILICENNGFSEFSPASTVTAGRIVDRASPYGIPGVSCDGNDVVAVWQTAAAAVRRARDGGGPTLIEAKTYRTRGHVESEDSFLSRPYRDPAEVKEWEARDPIPRLAALLRADSAIGEPGLGRVDAEVAEEVNDAFSFAKSSPLPLPETATLQMFA